MTEKKEVPAKVVAPKTATATTEVILGKAAKKMEDTLTSIQAATLILKDLIESSEDLTLKIAEKEIRIAELETEFKEGQRQNRVNLELDFKENTKRVVDNYLASLGLVTIADHELDAIKDKLTKLEADFDKDVASKVNAAIGAATKEFNSAKALYISEEAGKVAQTKAEVATLTDKVNFLTVQNKTLLDQLKEAGDNSVKIAEAGSIKSLSFGSDGTRK